jgi:hypothetical protein
MGDRPRGNVGAGLPAVLALAGLVSVLLSVLAAGCTAGTESTVATSVPPASSGTVVPTETTTSAQPVSPPVLALGRPAALDGVDVVVTEAWTADSVTNGLRRGRFLVVSVEMRHAGGDPLAYSPLDWQFLPEGGDTLVAFPLGDRPRLAFGTLFPEQTVTGWVAFELGEQAERGVVAYIPAGDTSARASWRVDEPGAPPGG